MEQVISGIVVKENNVYGMQYTELIPVAFKAIQQLQNLVTDQNKKIDELQHELNAIRLQNK